MIREKDQRKASMEEYNKIRTLSNDFCSYIASTCDFPSLQDYYAALSNHTTLYSVKKPLLLISAEDDPLCGRDVIPFEQKSSHVLLAVTKRGGHVMGYEGAILPRKQFFLDPVVMFLNYFKR
mmetsp:Transcript_5712/g.4343  ORF Transcript_5712/g.4343 Transcript_5712/m.4343 type:complete len:122 (+) Transcript_5712:846-1211(+)